MSASLFLPTLQLSWKMIEFHVCTAYFWGSQHCVPTIWDKLLEQNQWKNEALLSRSSWAGPPNKVWAVYNNLVHYRLKSCKLLFCSSAVNCNHYIYLDTAYKAFIKIRILRATVINSLYDSRSRSHTKINTQLTRIWDENCWTSSAPWTQGQNKRKTISNINVWEH